MKIKFIPITLLVSLVLLEAKMMDMTHFLNERAVHADVYRNFSSMTTLNKTIGPVWFRGNDIALAEHTGTHVDAPYHMNIEGRNVQDIPPEDLVGPAVVLDVSKQAKTDPDYALKVEDIEAYESAYGPIPNGAIVFLYTEGSEFYNDMKKYLGKKGDKLHFPGFGLESTRWLIKNRKIKGIGSDRLSFDVGKSETYPVHSVIGTENLYGLENVANIHKIPHKGATVVVLPMPLEKGTGGPTRILAFWGNNNEIITSDCVITGRASILMIVCMLIMHTFVHLI